MTTLQQSIDAFVGTLPKRQKEIIIHRFGLSSQKPKTLAMLGSTYGITRERVRQIEAGALKTLREIAKKNDELLNMHQKCVAHLKTLGGVRRADLFYNDLAFVLKDENVNTSYVDVLFGIFGLLTLHPENKDTYAFWYEKSDDAKNAKKFVEKVASVLRGKKELVINRGKFDELFYQAVKNHNIQDFVGLNFLMISKKFSANPYGDFGLVEWREISPKTVRDKAYLVLRKHQKPIHFRDIAQEINKVGFDKKKAHPQTVHNEVIKDRRFVLVGRGLYSLKEFGIEEGTTQELLKKLLKKHGPLDAETLVGLVSQQRILKKNTILLNLQNKKHFKKLSGGKYHLA